MWLTKNTLLDSARKVCVIREINFFFLFGLIVDHLPHFFKRTQETHKHQFSIGTFFFRERNTTVTIDGNARCLARDFVSRLLTIEHTFLNTTEEQKPVDVESESSYAYRMDGVLLA